MLAIVQLLCSYIYLQHCFQLFCETPQKIPQNKENPSEISGIPLISMQKNTATIIFTHDSR